MSNNRCYSILRRSRRISQQNNRGCDDDGLQTHPCQLLDQVMQRKHIHRSSLAPTQSSRPPRPLNSFMCFRREYNQKFISHEINQCDVSSNAAKEWRKMTAKEKEPYIQQAVRERADHAKRHFGYEYKPSDKRSKPHHPVTTKRQHRSLLDMYADWATCVKREPIELEVKVEEVECGVTKHESHSPLAVVKVQEDGLELVDDEVGFVLTENIPDLKLSDDDEIKLATPQRSPNAQLQRAAFNPRTIIGFLTDFEPSRGSPTFDRLEWEWDATGHSISPFIIRHGTVPDSKDVFSEWIDECMYGED